MAKCITVYWPRRIKRKVAIVYKNGLWPLMVADITSDCRVEGVFTKGIHVRTKGLYDEDVSAPTHRAISLITNYYAVAKSNKKN